MELFDDLPFPRAAGRPLPRPWPDAETPLGTLVPSVTLDGVPATSELPSWIRAHTREVTHYRWAGPIARCELLRIAFNPAGVDGAVGFVWRVAAWREVGKVVFTCRWQEAPGTAFTSRTEPGFELIAWTLGDRLVAIGTEDLRRLRRRATANDGLPARFAETARPVSLHGGPDRSTVTVTTLDRHEHCQVQFVVAWGPAADSGAIRDAAGTAPGTLFALTRTHQEKPGPAEP